MNVIIAFLALLSSSEKGLNGDSNPDLCDAGAVLHQLRYQGNWELIVMWVDHESGDVEIHDSNTIILVFEMRIGMNEFDDIN